MVNSVEEDPVALSYGEKTRQFLASTDNCYNSIPFFPPLILNTRPFNSPTA